MWQARTMWFQHSEQIWTDFPELAAGVLAVTGITGDDEAAERVADRVKRLYARADDLLASASEAELPQIRAWRAAFARMGLKPTQYRCAAESLLRRYRKEGALPAVHPLVDLCNAISLAYAVPIAVIDTDRLSGPLTVRYADGSESYSSFSGETEHPYPGEVIFADQTGNVHARRWCHRQSAQSAVSATTTSALIVAEAMHESARSDVALLLATAAGELTAVWPGTVRPGTVQTGLLSSDQPRFGTGTADPGSQPSPA
jgi:DNA/RNA-binding domain of Phe-tRNA-synthetase-like protein